MSSCHFLLDPINLVTSIYRLARMFSLVRPAESRQRWRGELWLSPTFQLLLRELDRSDWVAAPTARRATTYPYGCLLNIHPEPSASVELQGTSTATCCRPSCW